MSTNIPPLVSSSPPPLCDSDDEEEDDENEYGMFTTAEELDYNDCIPFQATNETKINLSESASHTIRHRGTEQDSTSQDSTTDSGLCPDSEGMSPTPHSDDERTEVVKIRVCERLQENSLNNYEDKKCVHNENGGCDYLGTITNIPDRLIVPPKHKSWLQSNGETQTLKCSDNESEILNNTDSCDDFGNFEFASISDEHFSNGNNFQNNDSSISESGKCESQETEVFNGSRASSTNSINIKEEHSDKSIKSVLLVHNDSEQNINSVLCSEQNIKTVLPIQGDSELDIKSILAVHESEKNILETNSDKINIDENNDITDLILDPVNSSLEEEEIRHDLLQDEMSKVVLATTQQINFSEEGVIDNFGDFQFESEKPVSEKNEMYLDSHLQTECVVPIVEGKEEFVEFDEFSDFADFSNSNFNQKDELNASEVNISNAENSFHFSQTKEEVDKPTGLYQYSDNDSWSELFPVEDSRVESSKCISICVEDSPIWRKLYPIESSPALLYQWNNSYANKKLLSALNIDSRNILFMPWCNMSVPRFAANLGFGPLEPVRASESLQPALTPSLPTSASTSENTHEHVRNLVLCSCYEPRKTVLNLYSKEQTNSRAGVSLLKEIETVPDAHFDWVSSGLTNPLDYPESTTAPCKPLSSEAEKIVQMLPNLSYMKKTYLEFATSKDQ